jgi:hypothetical protein
VVEKAGAVVVVRLQFGAPWSWGAAARLHTAKLRDCQFQRPQRLAGHHCTCRTNKGRHSKQIGTSIQTPRTTRSARKRAARRHRCDGGGTGMVGDMVTAKRQRHSRVAKNAKWLIRLVYTAGCRETPIQKAQAPSNIPKGPSKPFEMAVV